MLPKNVVNAMQLDKEFDEWVRVKIEEKPSRVYEKWFKDIIIEWAEHIILEAGN